MRTPLFLIAPLVLCVEAVTTVAQTNPWVRTNWPALNAQYLDDMCIDLSGRVYVVTYVNQGSYHGVWRSDDNGNNWIALDFPDSNLVAVATTPLGHVYVGSWGRGVYRSTDHGSTWTNTGIPSLRVKHITSNPAGDIFVTTFGDSALYRSTDNGLSWRPQIQGIPFQTDPIYLDAVTTGVGGLVYATADQVYRSSDNGEHWLSIGPTYTQNLISLLVTSPGHILAGGLGGVQRTTNDGSTWETTNFGATAGFVRSLVANSSMHIFRGIDYGGVYFSDDGGTNWYDFNSGLTDNQVFALAVNPGGFLFAATHLGGVFRTTFSTTSVESDRTSLPRRVILSQNYPNPFNPATNIQFSIVNRQLTIVKVYDVLGREVATLVNEVKEPGTYALNFDASHLSSGVYFYRLTAGDFVQTKKLLLLR